MANNGNGGGGFVLGLFVGGTIGALLGLLLAPRSGSETRAELREIGETWRTRADEMAADVRGYGRVGPAVDSLRERGSSAFGAVRSRINGGDGHQPTQPTAPDTGAEAEAAEVQPPASEQPPANEQPPASEQSPVNEQPPASKQPPANEPPPASKQPPASEQSPTSA